LRQSVRINRSRVPDDLINGSERPAAEPITHGGCDQNEKGERNQKRGCSTNTDISFPFYKTLL
jgi:hypothetical protein